MAVLSWHYQSFAKVFCHFSAIFVLCSCSVTSLSVPPELWSESCCHPTPKRAGLCHPLLVRVPATLDEVCQAPDLCQALAHPAQGTHSAMPGLCPYHWLSPVARQSLFPLGQSCCQGSHPSLATPTPRLAGRQIQAGNTFGFLFLPLLWESL